MSESLGTLIKTARTKAGMSQQALAEKIDGLSASDISKTERGEKIPTNEQLKAIAKNIGVTQKSLLEAAAAMKEETSGKQSASGGKTTGKTTSAKKTENKSNTLELTAAEKKLVQLYRKADSDVKKQVMNLLKGEEQDMSDLLGNLLEGGDTSELIGNLLTSAMGAFAKKAEKKD